MQSGIIISTTDSVPGREVSEILGVVKGNTIRARHLGIDILAGLKTLIGGEIKGYVQVLTAAREEAIKRMAEEAHALGADAVIEMRMTTAEVMAGTAEILAYGTAVKLK